MSFAQQASVAFGDFEPLYCENMKTELCFFLQVHVRVASTKSYKWSGFTELVSSVDNRSLIIDLIS